MEKLLDVLHLSKSHRFSLCACRPCLGENRTRKIHLSTYVITSVEFRTALSIGLGDKLTLKTKQFVNKTGVRVSFLVEL